MAIQEQERRGTKAENDAFTGAVGEITVITDEELIAIHNGSDAGGNYIPTEKLIIGDYFGYASAIGTDTIALTVLSAVSTYAAGQLFTFKAQNTITGATTLNVNSIGVATIKKKDPATTSLVDTVAGDIIAGGIYSVRYDGTYFQLISNDSGGITSVSQGDLNTSTGAVSGAGAEVLLPGGEYGFAPQVRSTNSTFEPYAYMVRNFSPTTWAQGFFIGAAGSNGLWVGPSAADDFGYCRHGGSSTVGAQMRQRYVTASPPFDMGDGELNGFLFMKVNQNGDILQHYLADVPPWGYNGPTKIGATHIDRATGKKYKKTLTNRDAVLKNEESPKFELSEITQEIKNADMRLIPHPFGKCNQGEKVLLIDGMNRQIKDMIEMQNAGYHEEVDEILDMIVPDNEPLKRCGPENVLQVSYKTNTSVAKERREKREALDKINNKE